MGFLARLWNGFSVLLPWAGRRAIFEHVQSHLHPSGVGLCNGGELLPDEDKISGKCCLSFAPGAFDGTLAGSRVEEEDSEELYSALATAARRGFGYQWCRLYEMLAQRMALDYVDDLIERIVERRDIDAAGLYTLARFLVERAPDREAVKFGIALLGIFRNTGDRDIFMTLGRHDEFTLYCAVALVRTQEDPEDSLWSLARSVRGWGRVQVVERLSDTENPRIKDWLLREGFRNTIMYQYVACTCAVAGDLFEALEQGNLDDELIDGACDILAALASGGPAEDMEDFPDGPECTELLLQEMTARAATLSHFCSIAQIRLFLNARADDKPRPQKELGWSKELCLELCCRCDEILYRSWWPEQVRAGLESEAEEEFLLAARAAKVLKIPTFKYHWRRLLKSPKLPSRWFFAIDSMQYEDLDAMISFAERNLNLHAIASGPAEDLGIGQGYREHTCLDIVLQKLGQYPGKGWELIETSLLSPVVRNRVRALEVLEKWKGQERGWMDYMDRALMLALRREPDGEVEGKIKEILSV